MCYTKWTLALLVVGLQACASAGWTNEDAGLSVLASDVSVPANGKVVYTIDRQPRMSPEAQQWAKQNGVRRTFFSWLGLGGPKLDSAGAAKNHMDK